MHAASDEAVREASPFGQIKYAAFGPEPDGRPGALERAIDFD